jgi:hypothetical protein
MAGLLPQGPKRPCQVLLLLGTVNRFLLLCLFC